VVQGASIVLPTFGTPAWALRTVIAIAFIGFPVALFVAWFSIPHPHPDDIPTFKGLTPGEFMLIGLLGGVLLLSLAQLAYQFSMGAGTAPKQAEASLTAAPPASPVADSLRVAVIPFDIIGSDSDTTRAFADTLLDKIDSALAANQVDTVSRADSLTLRGGGPKANATLADLRVGLTLEGSVQNDGKTITVRLHLDDVRQHQTLWSKEFKGPVDAPEPLQTQAALHATDVTRWAVSPRLKSIRSDPSLVAAYLEGQDEDINEYGGRALAIARDLVARAPRFAAGHTLLASMVDQENGLAIVTPEARLESTREAKIAIALDGGNGQAYAILSANVPLRAFKEREDLLLKGLAIEPGDASANSDYIFSVLADSGRFEEAIAQARSAWNLAPFTEWVAWSLPNLLGIAGRIDEARQAIADMNRKWPDNQDVIFKAVEFTVESQKPPFTRALALLDDPDLRSYYERPPVGKPGAIDALRAALQARMGSPEDKRAAAQVLEKSVTEGAIPTFSGLAILASLGDVDGAFRTADRVLTDEYIRRSFGEHLIYFLFGAQASALRRDQRFMPLMQRFALIDYWRTTGHWPDFCSEPGLPYDCKAVAAKLAAASPSTKH
jgi:TolB-like protein/tetratricopeptide (TPR) repeat protein